MWLLSSQGADIGRGSGTLTRGSGVSNYGAMAQTEEWLISQRVLHTNKREKQEE